MNSKTPIAVFAYNRPRHLHQLLDSLLQCRRLDECQVHIFCDGAKKPGHEPNVFGARQVVDEFAPRLNAVVSKSEQNIGCAKSIVLGVYELCEKYGRVIVLEDDLILHPFFLDFMLQSLDRYADDKRVAQIAGFKFPIRLPNKLDAFFLPLTTSWGWATWQRAWKLYSWDLEVALQRLDADAQLRTKFDLDGAYSYTDMLRLTAEGKLDAWDIRWYWHTFSAGMLTLYPRISLVWQNGFDETATHTKAAWPGLQANFSDFLQEKWQMPVVFPEAIGTNDVAFGKLKNFLRPKPSYGLVGRFKKRIKHFINLVKQTRAIK